MSLIKDVKAEIKAMDLSVKTLRNFGVLIGGIFTAVGVYAGFVGLSSFYTLPLFLLGIVLISVGLLFPVKLRIVFKIWMGFAFTMGWFMSRLILVFLFYLVLTPVAFTAKIFGKRFLKSDFKNGAHSYWQKKDYNTDLEKMY